MILACVRAFLVGGILCILAQILIDRTSFTPARILVGYVVAGVAFGATGVFEPLAEWAGCGVTVPLLGFGGAIARGVRVAVEEQGLLGALAGPLTAASVGTAAALCFGAVAAFFVRTKPRPLGK